MGIGHSDKTFHNGSVLFGRFKWAIFFRRLNIFPSHSDTDVVFTIESRMKQGGVQFVEQAPPHVESSPKPFPACHSPSYCLLISSLSTVMFHKSKSKGYT